MRKEYAQISKRLKVGNWYRVWGHAELDSYLKCMVFNARSIEEIPSKDEVVKDECEVKRVELHAHTMMSMMDGVIEAKSLVNHALSLGHKAIAVTDHNVLQSYPDLFHAVCDYNKGKDVKGIMGMIKLELHNTFQKTNDWLDDHLFKPIKEKLGIEKFSDLGKKVMGIFGLDELYKSAKQALFGDPNNDEDHGIMGNIKDGIKEAFKSTGSWIKEGFINIKDAVWNTPLIQSLFNSPKQQQRRADREM